jgi:hypothetical protein
MSPIEFSDTTPQYSSASSKNIFPRECSRELPRTTSSEHMDRYLRNQKGQRGYTEACRGPKDPCPAVKLPLRNTRSWSRGSSRPGVMSPRNLSDPSISNAICEL